MTEQKEEDRKGSHIEPKADSDAGLGRIGRREQKAVQKEQEGRIRTSCCPRSNTESYHQEGNNSHNQRRVEIKLGYKTPKEFTDTGSGCSIKKRLHEITGIGKETDIRLMLEIGKIVEKPSYRKKHDRNQRTPFQITFLRSVHLHSGGILTISLNQRRPMFEYIVFSPKSSCFSHSSHS